MLTFLQVEPTQVVLEPSNDRARGADDVTRRFVRLTSKDEKL